MQSRHPFYISHALHILVLDDGLSAHECDSPCNLQEVSQVFAFGIRLSRESGKVWSTVSDPANRNTKVLVKYSRIHAAKCTCLVASGRNNLPPM